MKIYSVKDIKAGVFSTPFFQRNDVTAVRAFKNEVNATTQTSLLSSNPEDFELHYLGEFDERKGAIQSAPETVLLSTGGSQKEPTK